MREIQLSQGKVALVDDEDFEDLAQYRWNVAKRKKALYVVRHSQLDTGKRTMLYMHRQLLEAPKGLECDHINGNGLDNRRANLRLCTHAQNQYNRKSRGGSSRYKGVFLFKAPNTWQAFIDASHKRSHLGYFRNEIEAALAYDAAARELHGEFAWLNFPPGGHRRQQDDNQTIS